MRGAALLLAVLAAPGCIFVPTPSHGHLGGHGAITSEDEARLTPGRVNREAVLTMFGEPDATLLADRLFVYTWEEIAGYVIAQESGPVPKRKVFLVLFDDGGYVLRTTRQDPGFFTGMISGHGHSAVAAAAEQWAAEAYRRR